MNGVEYHEKEIEALQQEREEQPELYRNWYGEYGCCEDCDSDMVFPRAEADNGSMCHNCGLIQDEGGWGEDGPVDIDSLTGAVENREMEESGKAEQSCEDSGLSKEERQEKKDEATRNFGKMLQMIGILFSLTIIGAIIGIPLIVLGMHMEAKKMDDD